MRFEFFVLLSLFALSALESVFNDLLSYEIDLRTSHGLSSSSISHDNLQKIINGVQNGNKENIYYYGLLKLYGISVTKNITVAEENFQRAALLGLKEAATAYGMILLTSKDYLNAMIWFENGVKLGDMVCRIFH
jgi:TPR repeat protein